MRLYSKQQLIFRSFLTALITAIVVAAAVFVFCGKFFSSSKQGIFSSKTSGKEQNFFLENDSFQNENSLNSEKALSGAGENFSNSNLAAENAQAVPVAGDFSGYTQDELQNISVYEKYNEAVVNITTQTMGYNWFYEPVITGSGSGSGSIIDKRGYVVTNYHVIENASTINISLADGSTYEGKIVGKDKNTDIAVLKFDPPSGTELKTISFGDSENLKVGQKVIAIGNPFALERTMTTGIISGLGRPIQESGTNVIIRNMIQTDAAINPGNSGGPLLDNQGKMIGINTVIYSSSGNSAGVGFAIPVSTARRVVSELLQNGKVNRGTMDISLVQNTNQIARYAGYPVSTGLIVSKVKEGSKADKSGLKGGTKAVQYGTFNPKTIYLGGHLITKIDNIDIKTYADYLSALEDKKPGDTVTVTVYQGRGWEQIKVTLDSAE